jgi:enhancing lycopene biosynthesis protein 2
VPQARWPYAGAAAAVKAMKGNHLVTDIDGVCVDEENNIVTAPAFMCETDIHLVHDSVARMVETVLQRIKT